MGGRSMSASCAGRLAVLAACYLCAIVNLLDAASGTDVSTDNNWDSEVVSLGGEASAARTVEWLQLEADEGRRGTGKTTGTGNAKLNSGEGVKKSAKKGGAKK